MLNFLFNRQKTLKLNTGSLKSIFLLSTKILKIFKNNLINFNREINKQKKK